MNLTNCISCNDGVDISVMYTASYTKLSWKRYDALSNMLSLLNEIIIWPIPLCDKCSKIAYEKKIKSDINKYYIILLSGIFGGAIFLGLSLSSIVEDRPILKIICFGLFILCALVVLIIPFIIISDKIKLIKFSKSKIIPKHDENLAFIGMAEEIIQSSDARFKEYIKPKFLNIEEMPLDTNVRIEIETWRESPGKFIEEQEIAVYQHASKSKEELIKFLSNSGEISKLPYPDEWMKLNSHE